MNNIDEKDLSSIYFKQFMKFRKQTIVEISENTGINKRTIQGYAQGRPPFRKAPATSFLKITDYMDIDPHYMLGSEEWKLSDYLIKLCEEYKLKSLKNICELPDSIRLTAETRKYRAKKREYRKIKRLEKQFLRKSEPLKKPRSLHGINKGIILEHRTNDELQRIGKIVDYLIRIEEDLE